MISNRLFHLLFISLVIISCSLPEGGATIRLMNFNIAAGHGDLDEAMDVNHYLGKIYSFELDEQDVPLREFGLGFLSKKPFLQKQNHQLTRLLTQSLSEPELKILPGFREIVVEIDGNEVHIFNTHLDYRPDPEIRKIQTKEMMAIMESADRPMILLGDLNAKPDAPDLLPYLRC